MIILCAFCSRPATTVAYAFAVCNSRPADADLTPCMDRAMELFRKNLLEAARG